MALVPVAGMADDPAVAVLVPSTPPPRAMAMPQNDCIKMDKKVDGCHVVTNIFTCEQYELTDGDWTLIYLDGDQRAVAVRMENEVSVEAIVLDSVMKRSAYVDTDGEVYIMAPGLTGDTVTSLTTLKSAHTMADMDIRVGAANARMNFPCAVWSRPRSPGCRVFIGMKWIYNNLGLTSFGGIPSKWIEKGFRSCWQRIWGEGFPCLLASYGRHGNMADSRMEAIDWSDRCLPETSISTTAFLWMLAHFAHASTQRAGFTQPARRDAASEVLDALIKVACRRMKSRDFPIKVSTCWKCWWPRPSWCSGAGPIATINISENGNMRWGEIWVAPDDEAMHTKKTWKRVVNQGLPQGRTFSSVEETIPLHLAIEVLAGGGAQGSESLLNQVLMHLAIVLDDWWCTKGKDDADDDPSCDFSFARDAVEERDPELDLKLFRYVQGSKAEGAMHQNISIAWDKACPAFLNVMNSMVAYPSGVAANGPPQA